MEFTEQWQLNTEIHLMDCVSEDKTKFKEGFEFFFWKQDVGEEIMCTFFCEGKGSLL